MASVIKPFHHSKIGIARQLTEGRLNARAGTQIAYIILTESLGCVLARLLLEQWLLEMNSTQSINHKLVQTGREQTQNWLGSGREDHESSLHQKAASLAAIRVQL